MDGLELGVGDTSLQQHWSGPELVVQVPLEVAQSGHDFVGWWRNVYRIPRSGAADPIL